MLKRISGISNAINAPKTASTAMVAGTSVKFNGSTGFFVNSASADTVALGVVQRTIASTDGDYALNTPVLIDSFDQDQIWECDVTNQGAAITATTPSSVTLQATSVGQYFFVDAAATPVSGSIDVNSGSTTPITSGKIWVCVGYISPSKGLFKVLAQAMI